MGPDRSERFTMAQLPVGLASSHELAGISLEAIVLRWTVDDIDNDQLFEDKASSFMPPTSFRLTLPVLLVRSFGTARSWVEGR